MIAHLDRRAIISQPSRVLPRLITYSMFEGRPVPVRGRWFNPVINAHLKLAAQQQLIRSRVDRPIFLVGLGRSGTTILGRLLGAHRLVGFLDEPKAIWHQIIEDEDLLGTYGDGPVRLRLYADDAARTAIIRAHGLYSWYSFCTRSPRIVDKYPELVYRVPLLRAIFPDAHIVSIVRRPWDVIRSIDDWCRTDGNSVGDWWGAGDRKWKVLWQEGVLDSADNAWIADSVDPSTKSNVERAAVEWLLAATQSLALEDTVDPGHLHNLRYNDLLREPVGMMTELLNRLELPPDARVTESARELLKPQREPAETPDVPLDSTLVAAINQLEERVMSSASGSWVVR